MSPSEETEAALASTVETAVDTAIPETPHTGTELARGAIVNMVSLFAANLRGIFTFLIARLLGHGALGTFGIAWSTTDLFSKFGRFRHGYEHHRARLRRGKRKATRAAAAPCCGVRCCSRFSSASLAALLGIARFPDDRPISSGSSLS